MKYRSVQIGLIALSMMSLGILVLTMFYYYKVQSRQMEAIREISGKQRLEMINNIMNMKREQAEAVLHENSAWDELVDYVNNPEDVDSSWLVDNVGSMSVSYNGANVAIFNKEGKRIYQNRTERYLDVDFFRDLKVVPLFTESYRNDFYMMIDDRIFEYFGSTIVSSDDINTRKEKPSGYMFLVREVNNELLRDYEGAMGDVKVRLAVNNKELKALEDSCQNMLFNSIKINNQYGNPIASLCFFSEDSFRSITKTFIPMMMIVFAIILLMHIIMAVYSRFFIVMPLMKSLRMLEDEDMETIEKMCSNKTEFGVLAKSMREFLKQKSDLRNLYNEMSEREEETKKQNEELNKQKKEIESQIDNIKVLNLQIMERNKETERKNVQILVKSKQLEEQNINIMDLQSTIEKLEQQIKSDSKEYDSAVLELGNNRNYASRLRNVLQVALTPTKNIFNDFFLYDKPKDTIGGDFYFAKKMENWVIAGVGDCNMHGISGAVLSGVDLYLLDDILNRRKISELSPENVLNDLNTKIQTTMGEEFVTDIERDGLHLSMFMYNTETLKGFFAGSKRTMVVARNGEVTEYFGDNLAIGKIHDDKKFNLIPIQMMKDDVVYMYSDGCTEVEGGPYMKKLLTVNFKKEILRKQLFTLQEQKIQFKNFFENWIGDLEQTDDITILAFKI